MIRILFIATLATTMIAPAFAQPNSAPQAIDSRLIGRVRAADANGDKMVTRQEFVAYRAKQFVMFDRNRDGYLTAADTPRLAGRAPAGMDIAAMTAQFDSDQDGRVSQAEFASGPTPAFDLCDSNGNQVATEAEINAALAASRRRGG